MATETWVHDGTQFRKTKEVWVHDGTQFRKCKEVWAHDGTQFRLVFRGFTPGFSASGSYGSFTHDGAYNTGAAIVIKTDGSVKVAAGQRSVDNSYWVTYTEYDDGTWGLPLTAGIGSQFYVKAVLEAGSVGGGGGDALNTVYTLGAQCSFHIMDGASSSYSVTQATFGIYIYSDSGGTNQVAYKSKQLTVANTNE